MAASGPNVPVTPVRTEPQTTETQGRYVGIGRFSEKGKGELVIPSLLTLVMPTIRLSHLRTDSGRTCDPLRCRIAC